MTIKTVTVTAARLGLGLVFATCGLDGFLHFLPHPESPPPEQALALAMAFVQSGYMMPFIKGTELFAGALLVSNRLVPLALVLLAPVLLNIVAFHLFLVSDGLGLALVLVALEIGLAFAHRAAFRPLFVARSGRLREAAA